MPDLFHFDVDGEHPTALAYPAVAPLGKTLLFGHGARAGQKDPLITSFAIGLAERGVLVVTYEFPFIEHGRRTPDSNDVLEACCRAAIVAARQRAPHNQLFIGGKSLGGRVAAEVAAVGGEEVDDLAGLVLLGYPLHPVGRPTASRSPHLRELRVPTLFAQGTRDVFGTPEELRAYVGAALPAASEFHAVDGGDHSFEVATRTGVTREDVLAELQDEIVRWMSVVGAGHPALGRGPRLRPIEAGRGAQLQALPRARSLES